MPPARPFFVAALALAAWLGAPEGRADTIVIPAALTSTGGNTFTRAPFNLSARLQQVYSAAQFTSQGVTDPIVIRGIRYRLEELTGDVTNLLVPSIRFDLSTTTATPGVLSTTFAANVGADNTTVFGGATGSSLTISGEGNQNPNPFDIAVNFTTPFVYDPSLGNLLLDIRTFVAGAATDTFDSQTFGAATGAVGRVFSNDVNSATGTTLPDSGHATQFVFTPTPEPGSLILFGLGAVGMFGAARRRASPDNRAAAGDSPPD